MSDSVRPHRLQPNRLPRPWDSPGKNTGMGCHFLLQCMKVKSEREVAQSCPTLSDPMDCSLPGSSIHGIFQARVLEWGALAHSLYCCFSFVKFETFWNKKDIYPKSCKFHTGVSQDTSLDGGGGSQGAWVCPADLQSLSGEVTPRLGAERWSKREHPGECTFQIQDRKGFANCKEAYKYCNCWGKNVFETETCFSLTCFPTLFVLYTPSLSQALLLKKKF